MMRLPRFRWHAPTSFQEAATILADEGPTAMVVAGGTDLYPNMKRRHQTPETVVSLNKVKGFRGIKFTPGKGFRIGAGTTLTELERDLSLRENCPGLWRAVKSISTPILRNMGTIGGNICLDTRCTYYNQNYEWRRAINFCMKCDGEICWVAPSSKICLAINSSDTAPILCAVGAQLHFVSKDGERVIPANEFYKKDGIQYLNKRPDEILTEVRIPPSENRSSTYWKLRRRGAFDFPVLGVGAAVWYDGNVVRDAKIFLGAVASKPIEAVEAQQAVIGKEITKESATAAGEAAFIRAKPMDNADLHMHWRKEMAKVYVKGALLELAPSRD